MIPIIGNQDVLIYKDPVSNSPTPYRWWAERGMIHSESTVTGSYKSMTVRTALTRMQALQDLIKNSRADRSFHADEIVSLQNYIDRMLALCEKAREQGMPDDPAHARQKAQEFKAKRHSSLVVVPGLTGRM